MSDISLCLIADGGHQLVLDIYPPWVYGDFPMKKCTKVGFNHETWGNDSLASYHASHVWLYPLVIKHSCGKSPCLLQKSTINGHFQ